MAASSRGFEKKLEEGKVCYEVLRFIKEDWLDESFSNSTLKGGHFERQFGCDLMGGEAELPMGLCNHIPGPQDACRELKNKSCSLCIKLFRYAKHFGGGPERDVAE